MNTYYSQRRWKILFLICLFIIIFLSINKREAFPLISPTILADSLSPHKVVVFNRVPKSGGTSVVRIFENLSSRNRFHVYRSNIFNPHQFLNPIFYKHLVDDIAELSKESNLLVHGHFFHITFRDFGAPFDYVYMNLLRDPLDRLVSKYYFIRFGDDHRPNKIRYRMNDEVLRNQTFDECVQKRGEDCDPKNLWVQIPFFCGTAAYCRNIGNVEALATAKRRLIDDYLLVGVLEHFNEFMHLLSHLLPGFLDGIEDTRSLQINDQPLWHLRKTVRKVMISEATKEVFRNNPIWQMEQAFYEFARTEFLSRYRIFNNSSPFNTSHWKQSIFVRSV